jgi:ATP:ADP antiporter, AAA family
MTSGASSRHTLIAAVTAALMIAQQLAGKAARDTLFLSSFQPSQLPFAMAAGAALSLAGVYWTSQALSRRAPAALIPLLFMANGLCFALEWALDLRSAHAAAVCVYLHTALLGPIIVSTFWSLINEYFDPHAAKAAVARIAGGGTAGGVLGGLASWKASSVVQPSSMLLFLAAVNALALAGTLLVPFRIEKTASAAQDEQLMARPVYNPFSALRAAPFLRNLGLLVAVGAASSAILDYIFSAQAVAHFGKGQALLSFFSLFWLVVGIVSFLLQLSLGHWALEKLGLAVNIALLPGIIILGGALGLAVPGLASASLLRGAEAVQRNTLFRSAYELLYTPLAEAQKRATKGMIDIGFDRLGTVVGSGIALLALHVFADRHTTVMLGAVVVLAFATLPLTRRLHLGYVAALEQSLSEGSPGPEPTSVRMVTAEARAPSIAPAREALIERLEALQPGGLTALLNQEGSDGNVAAPTHVAKRDSASLDVARSVLSPDLSEARRALAGLRAQDPAVACAIGLLARGDLRASAQAALIEIAPAITGQLIDVLLDSVTDFAVRRRVPRILCACSTQRAAEGLLLGLRDERFEVRYECGRALLQLVEGDGRVEVSRAQALAAIQCEIDFESRLLSPAQPASDDERDLRPGDEIIADLKRDRVNRSLEHVFNLLSLHLDREPLRIAHRALQHEDSRYRGTALEYLSTVLPEEIRELIWLYLGESAPLPTARTPHELLAELSGTSDLVEAEVTGPRG